MHTPPLVCRDIPQVASTLKYCKITPPPPKKIKINVYLIPPPTLATIPPAIRPAVPPIDDFVKV